MTDSLTQLRKHQARRHRWKKIKNILLIILIILIVLLMPILVIKVFGEKSMHTETVDGTRMMTAPVIEDVIVEDEGETIIYKGETYLYNENITAILCMGIDEYEMAEEDTLIGTSGQADMLLLAILDMEKGAVKLWNISRDSMTDVDIYNVDGEYVRTERMQACLAFAYGDGKEKSCENTVRSVSRLLYGMPIQSYAVLNMEAIRPLNDAVGGVEVTIHEGDILPARFKPGTIVLLQGDDVEAYVRSRRTELPDEAIDSNNNRMARQKQYMMNFVQKALQMTKDDLLVPVKLFNIAMENEHMITDLNVSKIAYLATSFANVNFSESDFVTVPGEVVAGEQYAEYHVDDEALYEMILDTFYVNY